MVDLILVTWTKLQVELFNGVKHNNVVEMAFIFSCIIQVSYPKTMK